MSGERHSPAATVELDLDARERYVDVVGVALLCRQPVERHDQLRVVDARQHQRPPGDAQLDAQRRLVRPVPETSPSTICSRVGEVWITSKKSPPST